MAPSLQYNVSNPIAFACILSHLKRNNKTPFLMCFSNSHPTSNQLSSFNASISPMFFANCPFLSYLKPAHHSSHQPLLPEFCHFSVSWLPRRLTFFSSHPIANHLSNTNLIMPFLSFNLQWFPSNFPPARLLTTPFLIQLLFIILSLIF